MKKSEVKSLRAALEANGWRISQARGEGYTNLTELKSDLAKTEAGRALLADLDANKPKSGPGGKSKLGRLNISGWEPDDLARVKQHGEAHGDVSAWARATLLKATREEGRKSHCMETAKADGRAQRGGT